MKQKAQAGFAHLGLILLFVIILAAVGGSGYYVWHRNHDQKKASALGNSQQTAKSATPAITTYDECTKAAGSIQQETFPPTCVTKTGQHFTQPTTQKYLTIKEWSVRAKYDGSLALQYKIDGNTATFTSAQLVAVDSRCDEFGGKIVRELPNDDAYPVATGSTAAEAATKNPGTGHAAGYYFFFVHDQSGCAGSTNQPVSEEALTLLSQTEDAVKGVAANLEAVPAD